MLSKFFPAKEKFLKLSHALFEFINIKVQRQIFKINEFLQFSKPNLRTENLKNPSSKLNSKLENSDTF